MAPAAADVQAPQPAAAYNPSHTFFEAWTLHTRPAT